MEFWTRLTGAFRYGDYRLLWLLTMLGSIAVWMRILGSAQWLLDETGSAAMVGAIGVVQLVIQIPSTLWAGTLADRFDRKRLLIFAYGLTTLTLSSLASLSHVGWLTPLLVYTAVGISAATSVLVGPARTALIPIIFPKEELMLATSTDTATHNVAAIIGPLLFAYVATSFDLTAVFSVAGLAASMAMLMPLLMGISGRAERSNQERGSTQLQQTIEGIRYLKNHPLLPGLYLLDIGITTSSFYREVLPVLALGLFAGGASATGLLGASNSAGAILGSLFVLLLVGVRAKGMLVLYASFAYGVFLFGFATADSLILGIVLIALLGAADAVTVAVRMATVMLTTPDHMRGRAFSLLHLTASTANNVGTIWVGFWAANIGAANTMIMAAFISISATALIWLFWKPIREFRSTV